MGEWVETYRGVVSAWECDIVEHFTIAYYFDRFNDATRNLLELIGEGTIVDAAAVGTLPARLYTTFSQELRAGAGFHILSAVTAVEDQSLRLGHRVVDSTSAQTVGWLAEALTLPTAVAPQARRRLEAQTCTWPGPEVPPPAALSRSGSGPPFGSQSCQAMGDRRGRYNDACCRHPSLLGRGYAVSLLAGHDRGIHAPEPPRLLDFGAGPEGGGECEGGRAGRRQTSISHLGNTSLSHVITWLPPTIARLRLSSRLVCTSIWTRAGRRPSRLRRRELITRLLSEG